MVAAPLAVSTGLNEPQLELEQLTDQLAPLLLGSFATVAVIEAVLPAATLVGTCENVTVIDGTIIWIVAEADFVLSAVEVTVIVTYPPPEGTAAGATYTLLAMPPLASDVCAEFKEPQAVPVPAQDTVQSAPWLVTSLRMVALRLRAELVCKVVGGAGAAKATEMGGPLTLSVTVTLLVGSAVETAVRFAGAEEVFWPLFGIEAGAVYMVTAPLAVWAGLKVPHFVVAQLTCQSTPMFWESLTTVAITGDTAAICKGDGGSCVSSTWIELGVPRAGEPELAQPGIQSSDSVIGASKTAARQFATMCELASSALVRRPLCLPPRVRSSRRDPTLVMFNPVGAVNELNRKC